MVTSFQNASPQVRARYEAKAKQSKEQRNIPIQKFTSHGVPLSAIEQQQKEIQEAIEAEVQDIKNMIKTKALNQSKFSL